MRHNNGNPKNNDLSERSQAEEQLRSELQNHAWAMNAQTHSAFWKSMRQEIRIFRQAAALEGAGVEIFRAAYTNEISTMRAASFDRGEEWAQANSAHVINSLQAEITRLRDTYMTALDKYKEKLESHDWYSSFSDDAAVWRAGELKTQELEKEAKEGGPEFEAALVAKRREISENLRKGVK